MTKVRWAAAAALVMVGCGGANAPTPADPAALVGRWRLVALQPHAQPVVPVPAGTVFTAEFGANGALASVVDCNRCVAGYQAAPGTLSVTPMACTRAYCAASAPFDDTYQRLLGGATTWEQQGDSLRLVGPQGGLAFVR